MNHKFKYSRDNARSALALGKLERAVMETLWDCGEISGSEVNVKLGKKLKVRHNTLLTVMERLVSKGLISKRKVGKLCFYKPSLSRDEFCAMVAEPIFSELLKVSSNSTLAAFVDQACRDSEKLELLKHLIEETEKKNKSGR